MTDTTNMRLSCPHCGHRARIRTSEQVSPTYRQGILECQDIACGWRGKLALSIVETYTPAARPNPRIHLPLSPTTQRRMRELLARDGAKTTTEAG